MDKLITVCATYPYTCGDISKVDLSNDITETETGTFCGENLAYFEGKGAKTVIRFGEFCDFALVTG